MGIIFNKKKHSRKDNNKLKNKIEINEGIKSNLNKDINSCIKIYLIGNGNVKNYLINYVFKDTINDDYLKTKGEREFKTDQFHWILTAYSNESQKEICDKIKEDITKDRNEVKDDNNKKLLDQRIIICLGKNDLLSEYFKDMVKPRIIFITNSKYEINIDKRYITNIIDENMQEQEICSQIISCLWDLDCYFNGRDNRICRYSPDKILKGLEKDNSLFSINILLLGKSGAGKSTFINLIAGKMIALESDNNTQSTKKLFEYYIYKNDDKEEHGAIKLIDTPGIDNEEYNKEKDNIKNLIKNNDKETNLLRRIHFIFFILNFEDNSLEEENIEELFNDLMECKCPIYFIINQSPKSNDDDMFIEDKFNILQDYLVNIGCDKLLNEDKQNFIIANFKNNKEEGKEIFGINNIFIKIKEYFTNNNILNEQLKKEMDKLLKKFRKIELNNSFLPLKEEDEYEFKKLKNEINFEEEMNKIMKMAEKNEIFSKIDKQSIIDNGRACAKESCDIILSLTNLNGIMPCISKEIPINSILQAFMVKEIENGYGLNINSLNYGLKLLKRNLEEILEYNKNNINNDNINNNNIKNVNELIEIIPKEIQDMLEKSNKKLIIQLSSLLNKLAGIAKYNQLDDINNFNEEFTLNIKQYCSMFFEKEIIESEGLSFMVNYYNKLKIILDDIDYYINEKNWDKFEMEIKK